MIIDNDNIQELHDKVRIAIDHKRPLCIVGGGSKAFYGNEMQGDTLHLGSHSGVIAYEPSELFVTVRAGTNLLALDALLAQHGQMLAFEPPCFTNTATVGGAVAAGLSGPARPWLGAVRDHILGVKLITGYGKIASFGGQVMKNVAGYDVSRLMVGSLGTLAVILEVSLKVIPRPLVETTLALEMPETDALALGLALRRQAAPLTGSCYYDGCLYLRVAGTDAAVQQAVRQIGGEILSEAEQFWLALRHQTHEFFQPLDRPLWRLSFPPATPTIGSLEGHSLVEWLGAQRWIYSNIPVNLIRSIAEKYKGQATLYRGRLPGVNAFHPQPPAVLQAQKRLKQALDPQGIFNLGRMNRDW